jgi:predicted MFS family arabinose efflux permease
MTTLFRTVNPHRRIEILVIVTLTVVGLVSAFALHLGGSDALLAVWALTSRAPTITGSVVRSIEGVPRGPGAPGFNAATQTSAGWRGAAVGTWLAGTVVVSLAYGTAWGFRWGVVAAVAGGPALVTTIERRLARRRYGPA